MDGARRRAAAPRGARVRLGRPRGCAGDQVCAPAATAAPANTPLVVTYAQTEKNNIAGKPFTLEIWALPDGKDGVLVSHGGPQNGAGLFIEQGKVGFVINSASTRARATVRGGGEGQPCKLEFAERSSLIDDGDIQPDDERYLYEPSGAPSFTVVSDPKSLLYIYGMQLDFSSALIGGGFNFTNPNASQTCGCGSSFAV